MVRNIHEYYSTQGNKYMTPWRGTSAVNNQVNNRSLLQNYITTRHFYTSVSLKINFYSKGGGATRVGSLGDVTSALWAPFRRSRAVLFFHFRTPRAWPLLFSRVAAAPPQCFSATRFVSVVVCSPQPNTPGSGGEKKSGFAVVSPPDFTVLLPARGFLSLC